MHAYLFVSQNFDDIEDKIRQLLPNTQNILHFTIQKISDTKQLIQDTNVSQLAATVILLENFDKASVEAQNAFLKRLEEPQEEVKYVLTAENESLVLPTIISRCEIVRFYKKREISPEVRREALSFAEAGASERLLITSKITKREDAVVFLESLVTALHEEIGGNLKLAGFLKKADETLWRIKKNGNPTLQLTNLAITTH